MEKLKVLLVQLASNGDCLFATTIARQIKEIDYPGCHLTWMIGASYKNVIANNIYIDEIIEVPILNREHMFLQRNSISKNIFNEEGKNYDKIFITDCTDDNQANWYGTIRSSLFRGYPNKIKINPQPVISLTPNEVNRVKDFADKNFLDKNGYNILFECAPETSQSNMTFERSKVISAEIIKRFPHVKIILSSKNNFVSDNPNIIDGSNITWKENAELTNYCHLLLGCSSGITWLSTCSWSKKLPMVQSIDPFFCNGKMTASVKIDFQYLGLNTNNIIEIGNADDSEMINCVSAIIDKGFKYAAGKFFIKEKVYYGGKRFLKDVFKNGSYKKGNLSNLRLLIYLIKCDIILSKNNLVHVFYSYPKRGFYYLKRVLFKNNNVFIFL